ncbi:MAG: choice-of-anchor J domain-containing protein [Dysgonomonas sp.]|nr:choice-of-anchor J domain-containing protein [Dysgonomonas sp.]
MQKIKKLLLFLILFSSLSYWNNKVRSQTSNEVLPLVAFNATGGYTTQTNQGTFIPLNSSVTFTDATTNNPIGVTWAFEGGNPTTSDKSVVNISYSTKGKYDVTLNATNAIGTSTLSIPDFVQVGNEASIWNMPKGETGENFYKLSGDGGYLTGTNNNGIIAFAEKFSAPAAVGEISEVKIFFARNTYNTEDLIVSVYSVGDNKKPLTQIASTKLDIDYIISDRYTTVTFDEPVVINDDFFIVVTASQNNTIAIGSSTQNINNNSAYYLLNNEWYAMNEGMGLNLCLNIVPTFQYNELDVDRKHLIFDDKNSQSQTLTVSSNTSWKAIPSAPWIRLTDITQNSFKVSLDNNKHAYKSGYITLTGGGLRRIINVEQAMAVPLNLTAVNDGDHNVKLKWNKNFVLSEDLYDDFESYTPFTINPSGSSNWYYIDGDGLQTYSIANIDFPNSESPMAFMIFDPDKTTPPISSPNPILNAQAHSGTKSLVCFSSPYGKVNDWFVSPELNFEGEFRFSFWAKSGSIYLDSFRVMYSTSHEGDFVQLSDNIIEAPASWTRYEYIVPAGTRYVAINCVSDSKYIFMIDDVFIGQGNTPASASIQTKTLAVSEEISYERQYTNKDKYQIIDILEHINNQQKINKDFSGKFESETVIDKPTIVTKKSKTITNVQLKQVSSLKTAKASLPIDPSTRFIKWHNEEVYSTYGIGGSTYEAAIRFNAEDLALHLDYQLASVDMHVATAGTYVLKIYKNGNVIAYQPINNIQVGQTFRVDLIKPITIDTSFDELLIAYEVSNYSGTPSAIDKTANVRNRGALIKTGQNWVNLTDASVTKGNWIITGVLNKIDKKADVTYNIYRQGEKIATTNIPFYKDEDIPISGNICYTVTATQNSGSNLESSKSNQAFVTLKQLLSVTANNAERYYGEDNPDVTGKYTISGFLNNDTDAVLSKKPVVSIDPLVYYKFLQAGLYENAIEINGAEDNANKYRFVYKNGNLRIKPLESDASLSSLLIDNQSFSNVPELYTIDCDSEAKETKIEITPNDPKATIELLSNNPSIVLLGNTITVRFEGPSKEKVAFAIIAHDGKTRQEFSLFVEKPYCTDATLKNVKINGITVNELPELYTIDCQNMTDKVIIEVTPNDPKATIELLSNNSNIVLFENTITVDLKKPNKENITFAIIAHDGKTKEEFNVIVEKYFVFDDIVITRWGSTMTVINNPTNNGGYKFVSYKWYRNNTEISQDQSYYAGDGHNNGDKYYVELTTDHNIVLRTCEVTPTLRSLTVKAYPNPVSGTETVYVDADVDEYLLQNAVIEVYSTSGSRIKEVKVTGRLTPIVLETSSGTYIFKLRGEQGFTKELKVIKK